MPSPPERVTAQAIGFLVDPWRARAGSVHSTYRGAVNVTLGARLFTLAPASTPDGPAIIRIPEPEWPRLSGTTAGAPAVLRAACLGIGATVVDLRSARVWRPANAPQDFAPGALGRITALREAGISRGAAPWIPAFIGPAVTSGADWAMDGLVGRGIGLTPSGDDALVGAMAACFIAGRWDRRAAAAHTRLAQDVRSRLGRTNDLSASFLEMAAAGHFQEPLWQAALAVIGGAEPDGHQRLLATGATSGADCALGLATAMQDLIDRTKEVAA